MKNSNKNKQKNTIIMVANTPEETGLASVATFDINQVPSYLQKVKEAIKALKGETEEVTKVTEELDGYGKIQDINDLNTLRLAYSYITATFERVAQNDGVFTKAAPTVKLPVFKVNGHSLESWQLTIISRLKEITYAEKLAQLEKAKVFLTERLSKEEKDKTAAAEFADIFNLG